MKVIIESRSLTGGSIVPAVENGKVRIIAGKLVISMEEKTIRTSTIRFCYQSEADTILFITTSGSEYRVVVNEKDLEFAEDVLKAFPHLKFTDVGKALILMK
jgi:hypothetical protein